MVEEAAVVRGLGVQGPTRPWMWFWLHGCTSPHIWAQTQDRVQAFKDFT